MFFDGFLIISGGMEVNKFDWIHFILKAEFVDDP